ncbi:MAG: hypothetical protein B0A82_09240 [Alkalinema sp. CACIAM 70d]|nr:MAG: hypothetical protein B0A82_09240 [Alkalinema sp. CACIAM 70d]
MNDLDFKRSFGARVKALRDKRGLTQEELAGEIGLSPHQLSAIERGISATKLVTARKIADQLRVDFIDLFDWVPRRKLSADEQKREAAIAKFRDLLNSASSPTFDDIAEIISPLRRR